MSALVQKLVVKPPQRLWGTYMRHLNANPVGTKAFTSFVAALVGDAVAQHLTRPQNKPDWRYDWVRTARLAVFNGAFMGPLGHGYYKALDARVLPHASKTPAAVAMKLAIDQMLFAPICTCIFYYYKVVTELRAGDYSQELHDKFVPTLLAGYKLWIPAHIINFSLVPPNQRILYANVVSVAGTYVLSKAAHKAPISRGTHKLHAEEVVFDGVSVMKED